MNGRTEARAKRERPFTLGAEVLGMQRERQQSPKAKRPHQSGEEMNKGQVLGSAFEPMNDGFV